MHALIYRGSDFEIHTARRSLNVNGSDIDCEPRVFDLIVYLIEQRERAVDKQELITRLWNGRPVSDASLSQLVYKARKALADDGATRACIQTMHGRGFRWVAAVTASVPAEPSPTAAANPAEPADAAVEPPSVAPPPGAGARQRAVRPGRGRRGATRGGGRRLLRLRGLLRFQRDTVLLELGVHVEELPRDEDQHGQRDRHEIIAVVFHHSFPGAAGRCCCFCFLPVAILSLRPAASVSKDAPSTSRLATTT